MATFKKSTGVWSSAYSVAVSRGFPYIRGEAKYMAGRLYNRFTKTADGTGPALYVSLGKKTVSIVEEEESE